MSTQFKNPSIFLQFTSNQNSPIQISSPPPVKASKPKKKKKILRLTSTVTMRMMYKSRKIVEPRMKKQRLSCAWINAATDAIVGNDQMGTHFWINVEIIYNDELPSSWVECNHNMLCQKFIDISRRVFWFTSKFAEIEALNQSGSSETMRYHQAQNMYEQDQGHAWVDEKSWMVLRNQEKWKDWSKIKFKGNSATAFKKNKE